MSRQEDFKQKATEYNNNVNMHLDFYNGAEYGYQYAKKRLREVLGFELDFNVAEFDDGVTTESLVDKICKRMEE